MKKSTFLKSILNATLCGDITWRKKAKDTYWGKSQAGSIQVRFQSVALADGFAVNEAATISCTGVELIVFAGSEQMELLSQILCIAFDEYAEHQQLISDRFRDFAKKLKKPGKGSELNPRSNQ